MPSTGPWRKRSATLARLRPHRLSGTRTARTIAARFCSWYRATVAARRHWRTNRRSWPCTWRCSGGGSRTHRLISTLGRTNSWRHSLLRRPCGNRLSWHGRCRTRLRRRGRRSGRNTGHSRGRRWLSRHRWCWCGRSRHSWPWSRRSHWRRCRSWHARGRRWSWRWRRCNHSGSRSNRSLRCNWGSGRLCSHRRLRHNSGSRRLRRLHYCRLWRLRYRRLRLRFHFRSAL